MPCKLVFWQRLTGQGYTFLCESKMGNALANLALHRQGKQSHYKLSGHQRAAWSAEPRHGSHPTLQQLRRLLRTTQELRLTHPESTPRRAFLDFLTFTPSANTEGRAAQGEAISRPGQPLYPRGTTGEKGQRPGNLKQGHLSSYSGTT